MCIFFLPLIKMWAFHLYPAPQIEYMDTKGRELPLQVHSHKSNMCVPSFLDENDPSVSPH